MQKQVQQVKDTISFEQAKKDIQKIVGLSVSRTWKGYGSAIFLELGELNKKYQKWINKDDGKNYSLQGDWTLSSDGGWLIRKNNIVIFDGLEDNQRDIEETIDQFDGVKITDFSFASDSNSVQFTFETNMVLQLNK